MTVRELIALLEMQDGDKRVEFLPETDAVPAILYEVDTIRERDNRIRIYLSYLDQE